MLEYTTADREEFWKHGADCYCVTTNMQVSSSGKAIMGGGIAKQAAKRMPWLPGWYADKMLEIDAAYGRRDDVMLTAMGWRQLKPYVCLFPTKDKFYEASSLELIESSARQLAKLMDLEGLNEVRLPAPGCGLGQLDWNEVRPVINKILDDRVTVWFLKEG